MIVNDRGLNDLLYLMQPKNSLDRLREKRETLLKKINQSTPTLKDSLKSANGSEYNVKQAFMELVAVDQEIQREVYEEKSKKLEIERLKNEEAAAKKFREKEKILARHEATLQRHSFRRLLSAGCKFNELRITEKSGVSLTLREAASTGDGNGFSKLSEKSEEINRDLKEAAELSIAAAKVAARRRKNRIDEETQEAASIKKQNRKSKIKSQYRKHINLVV